MIVFLYEKLEYFIQQYANLQVTHLVVSDNNAHGRNTKCQLQLCCQPYRNELCLFLNIHKLYPFGNTLVGNLFLKDVARVKQCLENRIGVDFQASRRRNLTFVRRNLKCTSASHFTNIRVVFSHITQPVSLF